MYVTTIISGLAAKAGYSYWSNLIAPYWVSTATQSATRAAIHTLSGISGTVFDAIITNPIAAKAGYAAYGATLSGTIPCYWWLCFDKCCYGLSLSWREEKRYKS